MPDGNALDGSMPDAAGVLVPTEQNALLGEKPKAPTAKKEVSPSASGRDQNVSLVGTATFGYALMFLAGLAEATRCLLFHAAEVLYGFPVPVGLLLSGVVFTLFSGLYIVGVLGTASLRMPRGRAARLATRGLLAATAAYGKNLALAHIPLGTELTIFSTSPVMAALLAAAFLGDALTWPDALVLALDIAGVVLVSGPSLPASEASGAADSAIGIAAAIGAAATSASGLVLVRVMGDRVHVMHNLFATGIGCLFLGGLLTSADDVAQLFSNWRGALLGLIAVLLGFTYQTFVNRGLQLCRPGPALVVRSFNVPVSFVLGLVFMGELVSLQALAGVFLVLVSIAYIGLGEVLRERGLIPERTPRAARDV